MRFMQILAKDLPKLKMASIYCESSQLRAKYDIYERYLVEKIAVDVWRIF